MTASPRRRRRLTVELTGPQYDAVINALALLEVELDDGDLPARTALNNAVDAIVAAWNAGTPAPRRRAREARP